MATPITNIPQGFISLTGLRDMGGVPREVVSTIAPGIDITQFLLLNRETVSENVASGTVITSVLGLSVPPSELWYVHAFSVVSGTLAAGDSIGFALGTVLGTTNVTISDTVRSAATGHRVTTFARDFWSPPGAGFSCRLTEIGGAGVTLEFRVLITRLRI